MIFYSPPRREWGEGRRGAPGVRAGSAGDPRGEGMELVGATLVVARPSHFPHTFQEGMGRSRSLLPQNGRVVSLREARGHSGASPVKRKMWFPPLVSVRPESAGGVHDSLAVEKGPLSEIAPRRGNDQGLQWSWPRGRQRKRRIAHVLPKVNERGYIRQAREIAVARSE